MKMLDLSVSIKRKGLLCKETHDTVIRFAPPLVISKEELDDALDRIRAYLIKFKSCNIHFENPLKAKTCVTICMKAKSFVKKRRK